MVFFHYSFICPLIGGAMKKSPLRFAVLMDVAFSEFQESIKKGISRYAIEESLALVYFGMGNINQAVLEDRAKEIFFEFITPEEFDGIIVISTSLGHRGGSELLRKYMENLKSIPMVSIGPSVIGEENFVFDNQSGMSSIMKHLIDVHAYRKFSYVSGPSSNAEARIRLQSYHDALETAGIPHGEETVYLGDFSSTSGLRAVTAFFDERKLEPQVIVCANDLMAIGVWSSLKKRGLSVPFDVAVTGYDDSLFKRVLSPHFTTVRQSFEKLSYLAVKRLHQRVLGKTVLPNKPFPTDLCTRNSCGCIEINNRTRVNKHDEKTGIEAAFEKRISESAKNWSPEANNKNIYHAWSNSFLSFLGENHTVHELEDVVRSGDLMNSFPGGTGNQDAVVSTLYGIFLEDCERIACADHCMDRVVAISLRSLTDRIQEEISTDYMLSTHASRFRDLSGFFDAKEMHLMQFDEPGKCSCGRNLPLFFRGRRRYPSMESRPGRMVSGQRAFARHQPDKQRTEPVWVLYLERRD